MQDMRNKTEDTICAIATGMGDGAIGIIRLSGPDAFSIAGQVFRGRKRPSEMESYTAAFGRIVRPAQNDGEGEAAGESLAEKEAGENPAEKEAGESTAEPGRMRGDTEEKEEVLDETVMLVMRAPHTYTTEDTVEFQCHGGAFGLSGVLGLLVEKGARLAEPGEFTRRAFLGGRIDMSQAEAVMDVIRAENDVFYRASQDQLGGLLRKRVTEMRDKLLTETARIESALDDPEHYDLTGYPEELAGILRQLLTEQAGMLRRSSEGIRLRDGIPTVIAGLPNVGKSSLMNALLGTDRAIVTPEEGTTRDTLTETIRLGNLTLRLTDTAGIRKTDSRAEEAGILRSYSSMEEAELVLLVLDASRQLLPEEAGLVRRAGMEKTIILLNKEDVPDARGREEMAEELKTLLENTESSAWDAESTDGNIESADKAAESPQGIRLPEILEISAREGTGLEPLRKKVEERFLREGFSGSREPMITSVRHKEALLRTMDALERVMKGIEEGLPEDFLTIDLMDAYQSLGRITGETLEDDLADKIFAEFCMGK